MVEGEVRKKMGAAAGGFEKKAKKLGGGVELSRFQQEGGIFKALKQLLSFRRASGV